MADVDVKVTGAEQLKRLGADLKRAGLEGKGLRRELLAGMRALGKPLAAKAQESAQANLPKRGGLNEWVAGSKFAVRNNLTGSASRVGMRIVTTKGSHDLDAIDQGRLRHPVYGNRAVWREQSVAGGWFTKPLTNAAPEVQAMLIVTMNVIGRRLESGF